MLRHVVLVILALDVVAGHKKDPPPDFVWSLPNSTTDAFFPGFLECRWTYVSPLPSEFVDITLLGPSRRGHSQDSTVADFAGLPNSGRASLLLNDSIAIADAGSYYLRICPSPVDNPEKQCVEGPRFIYRMSGCYALTDCASCIDNLCGWCAGQGQYSCLQGTPAGPDGAVCETEWYVTQSECSTITTGTTGVAVSTGVASTGVASTGAVAASTAAPGSTSARRTTAPLVGTTLTEALTTEGPTTERYPPIPPPPQPPGPTPQMAGMYHRSYCSCPDPKCNLYFDVLYRATQADKAVTMDPMETMPDRTFAPTQGEINVDGTLYLETPPGAQSVSSGLFCVGDFHRGRVAVQCAMEKPDGAAADTCNLDLDCQSGACMQWDDDSSSEPVYHRYFLPMVAGAGGFGCVLCVGVIVAIGLANRRRKEARLNRELLQEWEQYRRNNPHAAAQFKAQAERRTARRIARKAAGHRVRFAEHSTVLGESPAAGHGHGHGHGGSGRHHSKHHHRSGLHSVPHFAPAHGPAAPPQGAPQDASPGAAAALDVVVVSDAAGSAANAAECAPAVGGVNVLPTALMPSDPLPANPGSAEPSPSGASLDPQDDSSADASSDLPAASRSDASPDDPPSADAPHAPAAPHHHPVAGPPAHHPAFMAHVRNRGTAHHTPPVFDLNSSSDFSVSMSPMPCGGGGLSLPSPSPSSSFSSSAVRPNASMPASAASPGDDASPPSSDVSDGVEAESPPSLSPSGGCLADSSSPSSSLLDNPDSLAGLALLPGPVDDPPSSAPVPPRLSAMSRSAQRSERSDDVDLSVGRSASDSGLADEDDGPGLVQEASSDSVDFSLEDSAVSDDASESCSASGSVEYERKPPRPRLHSPPLSPRQNVDD